MTLAGQPERIVRVRTEVAAVSKEFDYTVPVAWKEPVEVGARVRAPLHGRTVRGWVVEDDVVPLPGLEVRPLKSWLGWGPPPPVVELARWAAWRWAGPESTFLQAASPKVIVRSLPPPPRPAESGPDPLGRSEQRQPEIPPGSGATVVRLPPATDLIDVVLATINDAAAGPREGSVLVLVPSVGWAERLCVRLTRRGVAATTDWAKARAGWPVVVGSRAGAWAPAPALAAVLVLDAHDDAYREESAPTYSAVDVARERASHGGVPCVLTSPVPPVTLGDLPVVVPTPADERAGWPAGEVVDRRAADPRTGLFSEEFVRLARSVLDGPEATADRGPLVCVYNRKGGARLLACSHCGEVATCTRCGAALSATPDKASLECPRCGETRPFVCAACGRLKMKTLRVGVSRLREELTALLGVDVEEVSGPRLGTGDDGPGAGPAARAQAPAEGFAPVLVGTEAVLHRVRRAAAVVFLDIDMHLLAPRLSATEESFALLVRAGRLVGPRGAGPHWARVQVQTRVPDHPVLQALVRGEPAPALEEEAAVRRTSGLPPYSALALVSGPLAPAYVDALAADAASSGGSTVVTLAGEGAWLVRAPDHDELCDLLARVERPSGRGLRVAVDPVTF